MSASRQRQSISLRLTLLFTAASTLVLLALGWLIGQAVERHFVEQDMELMRGKLELTAHLLEKIRSPQGLDSLPQQLDEALIGHHELSLRVLAEDGRVLYAAGEPGFPAALLNTAAARAKPLLWRHDEHPWRGVSARLPTGIAGQAPLLVAIAVEVIHHEHFMESFRRTLWLFVALAAAATALLGGVAVRRGLAPLAAIGQGAAAVTASRLDYRLVVADFPAELADVAQSLNDMLARLEDSFQRLKDFSSDLAHELRTPISNLMTETQVALTRARNAAEYREVLASNAEEYERLARMIGDMLFLAQADNGLLVPRHEAVDLGRELRDLFEFFDALAEDKGLRLSLTGTATVQGDRLMLRRALANLLSNAIRHTPEAGTVAVRLNADGAKRRLDIENSGEPIGAEHLPRLFDRFYRADPARHYDGAGDGAGLGLAITRSIVRAHGGDISAANVPGGVCFSVWL